VKLLYRPFGLVTSILGGVLAGMVFKQAWKALAGEPLPPKATDEAHGWVEIISAAALEGAVFGGVKALIDRAGAIGFARLTGVWPGNTVEEDRSYTSSATHPTKEST
jgi:hypothetical protein